MFMSISELPQGAFSPYVHFFRNNSSFQKLGKAERHDPTKFALIWNQIISSFRSEDLISDRYTLITLLQLMSHQISKGKMLFFQRDGFDDNAHVTSAQFWFYPLAIVFTC